MSDGAVDDRGTRVGSVCVRVRIYQRGCRQDVVVQEQHDLTARRENPGVPRSRETGAGLVDVAQRVRRR